MFKNSTIENLSQYEVEELYSNILETDSVKLAAWYCFTYCRCNYSYATYAYGYQGEDRTYSDYYNGWQAICNGGSYHLSGGCGGNTLYGLITKCYG